MVIIAISKWGVLPECHLPVMCGSYHILCWQWPIGTGIFSPYCTSDEILPSDFPSTVLRLPVGGIRIWTQEPHSSSVCLLLPFWKREAQLQESFPMDGLPLCILPLTGSISKWPSSIHDTLWSWKRREKPRHVQLHKNTFRADLGIGIS